MIRLLLLALSSALLLSACQNGRYVGPSLGISGGYEGVTIGFTVYGENPITTGRPGLTNGPVQATATTPAADPLPEAAR